MGKVSIGNLKDDQKAVLAALQAIKGSGDAPGDNSTTADKNHNFYYDDRTSYRDYVKAYNKLTNDQAAFLGDNSAPSEADMKALESLYNDPIFSDDKAGVKSRLGDHDTLTGQQLLDALKGNKGALDPKNFDADKAISLAGRLYQGEDLQHRVTDDGDLDLSSGPMDTRYTDYVADGGTHELNGHPLIQGEDISGKPLKDLDDLNDNLSARSFYKSFNEGKDPTTGDVLSQFKDKNGAIIHDAPFVQTADGKIYYPVYDGGANYLQRTFHGAAVSSSSAASIAQNLTEEQRYCWVEKDTRGAFQTAMDVLGSAAATFALIPLDPVFGAASRAVSVVARAGLFAARAAVGRGISGIAGAGEAAGARIASSGSGSSNVFGAPGDASDVATKLGPAEPNSAVSVDTPYANPVSFAKKSQSYSGDMKRLMDPNAQPLLPKGVTKAADFKSKKLWGDAGPAVADAKQGYLGNCWFCSYLQNIIKRDPDYFKDMIKPIDGQPGMYTVRLYNKDGKEVQVPVNSYLPTDASGRCILMGKDAESIGPALVEKAAAKLRDYDGVTGSSGGWGYRGLAGGDSHTADSLLFGPSQRNSQTFEYASPTQNTIWDSSGHATGSSQDYFKDVDAAVSKAVSEKRVATVGFATGDTGKGIQASHLYSVDGYKDGVFELLDPSMPEGSLLKVSFEDMKKLHFEVFA